MVMATFGISPGCGGDNAATGTGTTTIEATGSSTANDDPPGTTTGEPPRTGDDTTDTTGEPETETETGIGPRELEPSRARALYIETASDGNSSVFYVDYDDGSVTAPAPVLPVQPDADVNISVLSSDDGRWAAFRSSIPAPERHELYVVEVADPAFPNPVRVNVAPAVDPGWAVGETFSPGSTHLAFLNGPNGNSPYDLYLVALSGDPTPVRINPVATGGSGVNPHFEFSPDGTRIAYQADLDGSGVVELYVQDADVDDPGPALRVTVGGSGRPHWSPDGATIFYTDDGDSDGTSELYAVDMTGSPADPEIHDPGDSGAVRRVSWAPDGQGVTYWIGEKISLPGDSWFVPFTGGTFGTASRLNPTPGTADSGLTLWSPASTHIAFGVADGDTLGGWIVGVDNGSLATPTQLQEELAAGTDSSLMLFDPTGSAVFQFVNDDATTMYRVPIGMERPGPAAMLNLPDASVGLALAFSPDGSRGLFSATVDDVPRLYEFDADDFAQAPTQLSPSDGTATNPTSGWKFGPEGPAVFYLSFTSGADGPKRSLFAASTDEPGIALPLVTSGAVRAFGVFTLP